MGLRARISLFVFCAVTLLTGGILLGAAQLDSLTRESLDNLVLANQHTVWDMATERLTDALSARAAAAPQADLAAALTRQDTTTLTALLTRLRRSDARATLLDNHGHAIDRNGAAEESGGPPLDAGALATGMLDAGVLAGVLANATTASDLNRDGDGTLLASVATPLRASPADPIAGVLVLSRPVAPILADTGKASGSELFLLGLHGEPLGGGALPAGLAAATTPIRFGISTVYLGTSVLRLGVIPLLSRSGARLGWELSAADITRPYQRAALLRGFGLAGVALLAIAIQAALYLYLNRAFAPLERSMAALKGLAAGDTTVDISGEGSGGEVSRLAQAVRIVRDIKREESRTGSRTERNRRRQELFIRRQMLGLADTLDASARGALLVDLERIEEDARSERATAGGAEALGATAIAFRYMAERVKQQHADLARLVAELREALAAKSELMGLQQQVAIAARMQESILPKPLPPRQQIEIHGTLLPAREMDGDFYDFFPRTDGRIVVAAGEIGGSGLAKAFMMLVVRTMLKAMLLGGSEPAETLARMDTMLEAENEQQLGVRLFAALLDPSSGRLSFANAGYPAPLLVRRAGDVVEVSLSASEPLALGGPTCTAGGVIDLPVRATLLLASHGASGATDKFGRTLGREGVIAALQGQDDLGARPLCEAVQAAILALAPEARSADATCLAIRFLGS